VNTRQEDLEYLNGDWIDHLQAKVTEIIGARQEWNSPIDLAQHLDPGGYVLRAHLKHLSDRIVQAVRDVENGKSRFLLVSMPPRMGKSKTISVDTPAWVLHKHPDWEVMLLSHGPDLAANWGRQVRRVIEDHPELGLAIAPDAGAVTDWEVARTTKATKSAGGGVLSKSIRQSVTGRGAKVMILDDIVKDFADAHSKSNREFVWDWWLANSRTRLHPPALVIAVGTRWHEDDILGRFQSDEYDGDPDEWEVISLPAFAEEPEDINPITRKPFGPDAIGREPGEPLLSPLVRNETPDEARTRWAATKKAVGTYAWEALFQQRPNPAKGSIFLSDWWQFWRPGDLPEYFDRLVTSWDCAFKGTDSSDFVVGQLWGVSAANRFLLKQTRDRLTFTETLPRITSFIEACNIAFPQGVHEHLVEDKANGTAVIDVLRTTIPGMIPINPTESKEARARASSPEVESGNVFLPADEAWVVDFVTEHTAFPNGSHDDQVDAGVQARMRLRSAGNVLAFVPQGRISRGFQRPGAIAGRRR